MFQSITRACLSGGSFQVMAHTDWLSSGLENSVLPSPCCERPVRFFSGPVSFGGKISELI